MRTNGELKMRRTISGSAEEEVVIEFSFMGDIVLNMAPMGGDTTAV
jgi:hypothetical protein